MTLNLQKSLSENQEKHNEKAINEHKYKEREHL
jgi:hypothetical protein